VKKTTQSRTANIPDRVYFRIGEVSNLVGVDPHVLRYWESEFKVIQPRRAKSKQRLYRKKDVENLLRIKTLLHDEGYTIAGARRLLKDSSAKVNVQHTATAKPIIRQGDHLKEIKQELAVILDKITASND
jgi:DNA-binding transcriptional MerR regulator